MHIHHWSGKLWHTLMTIWSWNHAEDMNLNPPHPLLPQQESSSDDYSDTETESSFSLVIPQDYLGLAVFAMLCCFWPLGIAAFYLSQKVNDNDPGSQRSATVIVMTKLI